MSDLLEVRIACPDGESAQALAADLVGRHLAACAQVLAPMTSTYVWQGRVETSEEVLLLAKTTAGAVDALVAHVEASHPYDVPEVLAVPITAASDGYADWLRASVAPTSPTQRDGSA